MTGVGPLTAGALRIRRHAVGEIAGHGQQLDGRRAAPAVHVPARLPATEVGLLRGGMGFRALLDHLPQLGIERRRIRHIQDHERRGKQRDDLRGSIQTHTTHACVRLYAEANRRSCANDAGKT